MLGCLEEGFRWAWNGGLGMNVIQKLKALWEGVRLRKRGRGRPRTRPRVVYGDGADDSEAIRAAVRGGGIRAGIRENRRGRKKARKGRPRCFDEKADPAIRRSVERFFAWRKGGFRRLSFKTRATSLHVSRLRLPCLLPHCLESFEMSSLTGKTNGTSIATSNARLGKEIPEPLPFPGSPGSLRSARNPDPRGMSISTIKVRTLF